MTNYIPVDSPFYPTDHCGVLRCKTSEINPRYMAHILEIEGRKNGFSRSYRASIDRVQGIVFTVCERTVQDKAIHQIEVVEAKMRQAEAKLESLYLELYKSLTEELGLSQEAAVKFLKLPKEEEENLWEDLQAEEKEKKESVGGVAGYVEAHKQETQQSMQDEEEVER